MVDHNQQLDTLEDIKQLMHKSSRFISLSGWSGVAAGTCALVSAVYTGLQLACWRRGDCPFETSIEEGGAQLRATLLTIGIVTFVAAVALAFLFTYIRTRKAGTGIWDFTARKVVVNVAIPMLIGGIFIWRMMQYGFYGLVAPACLIFYGLGLINASKYTLGEIRYLGYFQLLLGAINLWFPGYGLYFWAAGFGVLHIIYGIVMWNRYERVPS